MTDMRSQPDCLACGKPQPKCGCEDVFLEDAGFIKIPKTGAVSGEGAGRRFDKGKGRPDLIPVEPLIALAHLYEVGSEKYDERNWEEGMRWGRCFGCAMRHIWKWWRGEKYDTDDKTGKRTHHLIAAIWNLMALYCYEEWKVGKDDRPTRRTQ